MLTDDVEEENMSNDDSDNDSDDEVEYITTIATSDRWTNYRNTLAQDFLMLGGQELDKVCTKRLFNCLNATSATQSYQ